MCHSLSGHGIDAECGGGTHEFLDYCHRRRVQYSIGFTLTDEIAHAMDTHLSPADWTPAWVEFMANLVCNISADGTAEDPRIEVEMARQCGVIYTREDARIVAEELQQAADFVAAWADRLPESGH